MSEPKLLTVDQAAEELQISRDAVRRAQRAGRLPVINVGTDLRPRYRITRADLDAFIARSRSVGPVLDLAVGLDRFADDVTDPGEAQCYRYAAQRIRQVAAAGTYPDEPEASS